MLNLCVKVAYLSVNTGFDALISPELSMLWHRQYMVSSMPARNSVWPRQALKEHCQIFRVSPY